MACKNVQSGQYIFGKSQNNFVVKNVHFCIYTHMQTCTYKTRKLYLKTYGITDFYFLPFVYLHFCLPVFILDNVYYIYNKI